MDFLSTVLDIMNDQEDIPGLPEKLMSYSCKGEIVQGSISEVDLIKIARLRTLMCMEDEKSEIPDQQTICSIVCSRTEEAQRDFLVGCINVREDAVNRMMLIEGLIVEIVRKAIPSESEYLKAKYTLTPRMELVRSYFPRICFK